MDYKPLGNIVSIKGGKRLPKDKQLQSTPNSHPYIRVRDMGCRYIPRNGLEYVPDHVFPTIARYTVNTNDLIISIVGTIGLISIIDDYFDKASQTENCAKLTGLDKSDALYLYYYLVSGRGQEEIRAHTVGAVQAKLPLYNIEKISVYWPDRHKRRKVASILSSLDDKILLNNQLSQTLESIAQAIFKSWFIDFEPVKAKIQAKLEGTDPEIAAMCAISGKSEAELEQMPSDDFAELQTTAALFPDELEESELGEVPWMWKILDIDKATSLIIDHRGKTPKKLGAEWVDSGITALSAKHIKDGCIVNREQLRFVDVKLYAKWMKEELEEGDILLTSEGPMGEMYYLAFDEKYCLSQRLYALRANTDLVTSAFLYFWLLSPIAKAEMYGRATGTTVVGIRQSELRKVRVLTPSKPICELFDQKVKAILKQIALNNKNSLDLAQIRDILLPKLLSGEMDVTALGEEKHSAIAGREA